jgi:hypothetical protein
MFYAGGVNGMAIHAPDIIALVFGAEEVTVLLTGEFVAIHATSARLF